MNQPILWAQDFKLFEREVEVHGFASQGFIYTSTNNWLTMNSNQGSFGYTDFGFNASTNPTSKLRVGAQLYDRNLGRLGQYHPSLDWAVVDYRLKNWFNLRGGKVKTTLGLYTDAQDLDFVRVFALLPQSVYSTDIRDGSIAHLGGDVYGTLLIKQRLGEVSYTVYAGHRSDSIYEGNVYLDTQYHLYYSSYGGLQYGGDLRWKTPVKRLMIGVSRLNEDLAGKAKLLNPYNPSAGFLADTAHTRSDWTNQFYGEYTVGKFRIDSEYRRFLHEQQDQVGGVPLADITTDVRGCYISGTYRVIKRLALGSYYSRYVVSRVSGGPFAAEFPDQSDTNLPANHIYDKVISARVDLARFWYVKVEGHFMNGYGNSTYPDGFYPQVNPQGFTPDTDALVIKTGVNF